MWEGEWVAAGGEGRGGVCESAWHICTFEAERFAGGFGPTMAGPEREASPMRECKMPPVCLSHRDLSWWSAHSLGASSRHDLTVQHLSMWAAGSIPAPKLSRSGMLRVGGLYQKCWYPRGTNAWKTRLSDRTGSVAVLPGSLGGMVATGAGSSISMLAPPAEEMSGTLSVICPPCNDGVPLAHWSRKAEALIQCDAAY